MQLSPDSSEAAKPTLAEPRLGFRLIDDDQSFSALLSLLASAKEVAVDAERASGYRYGNSAYLVQIGIENGCNLLIDPVALVEVPLWQSRLAENLNHKPWILHAATQDLPCLAEIEVIPNELFDTELAARLASVPRFGLASLCEELLEVRIAKEHSAADWSQRPLGHNMLNYAALDVEILFAIRDKLQAALDSLGRTPWAEQEFKHLAKFKPRTPAANGWRKLSGSGSLKSQPQQQIASALWRARDALAKNQDVAPGRLIPDSAIIAAALATPKSPSQLRQLKTFVGRESRRNFDYWWQAIQSAEQEQIEQTSTSEIPPHKIWERKFPDAWHRYLLLREAINPIVAELAIPPENLISPSILREIAWSPGNLEAQLVGSPARAWQIDLVLPAIRVALQQSN
jgi:ribonuclease D